MVATEISVTDSDDVLVARIVSGRQILSAAAKISCLRSSRSGTASIIRSTSARSSMEVLNRTRAISVVAVGLGQLAPAYRPVGGVAQVTAAALQRLLGGLDADDLQALAGEHLDDAGTHRAQAHDTHGREVSRHPAILPGVPATGVDGVRSGRQGAARVLAGPPDGRDGAAARRGRGGVRNAQSTLAVDVRAGRRHGRGPARRRPRHHQLPLLQAVVDQVLAARRRPPCTHLVVDMSGVGFADASGISPLLLARAMLARRNGRVELRHCRRACYGWSGCWTCGTCWRTTPRTSASVCAAVRLVIARCTVDYVGRLTAHLPSAPRLILVKADGSVSIHADDRAYKPLNWMSPPCTLRVGTGDERRASGP